MIIVVDDIVGGVVPDRRLPLAAAAFGLTVACDAGAAELSSEEAAWLAAAAPVLAYAQRHQLPIDIVVQPQPTPGQSPIALAFVERRCKLVLSMRGNPEAQALLRSAGDDAALRGAALEAMTAHEIGHCWRHVHGAWHTGPSHFSNAPGESADAAEHQRQRRDMEATRREEGFADLVGLAWTLRARPQQYAQVFRWLERQRAAPEVPGSHHDTRAWLALAKDPQSLAELDGSPFDQALALWRRGFAAD